MIIGTPEQFPGEHAEGSHHGKGPYFVRTLLDKVPGSNFKYVRDMTFPVGSTIGEHPHEGDEEIYFIIAGTPTMVVDGEARVLPPGSVVLNRSGSVHGLRNEGKEDVRMVVACVVAPAGK